MREHPSRDPRVNLMHRFGAYFYKNTFESPSTSLYTKTSVFVKLKRK